MSRKSPWLVGLVLLVAFALMFQPHGRRAAALDERFARVGAEPRQEATSTPSPTPTSTPLVRGSVELRLSHLTSCTSIEMVGAYTATSAVAPVGQMRTALVTTNSLGCLAADIEQEVLQSVWRPIVAAEAHRGNGGAHLYGFALGAQYKDALGNVSPVYCSSIWGECLGTPTLRPMPSPTARCQLPIALGGGRQGAPVTTTPPASAPTATSAPGAEPPLLEAFAAACQSLNPFFVTPYYAQRDRDPQPALLAFRNTISNSEHVGLATYGDVGATYGVAYDGRARQLYAAAYHKRAAPHGPGGPGAVYRVELAAGLVQIWVTVPEAGDDHHDPNGGYLPDHIASPHVGKTSLGDIDLSENGEILFVMNLSARRIERYRTATGERLAPLAHGAASMPWAAREARPFALLVHGETLYHGVVRDASASRSLDDLWAIVYASDLDGANRRTVLEFRLDYPRQALDNGTKLIWQPWEDAPASLTPPHITHAMIHPMPMLTDLELSDDGNLILGLRDRNGDMTIYDHQLGPPVGERNGIPFGDILIAYPDSDRPGAFTIEPWPEFFAEDASPGRHSVEGIHKETSFGGLARVHNLDRVVNTALAPLALFGGGAIWYDLDTGIDAGRETLYTADIGGPSFGKANGLGDAELLCGEDGSTPSPTPAVTPGPTPSSTPHRIHFPFAERACSPQVGFVDVVLVLDTSTSMRRNTRTGRTKLEAALEAAGTFAKSLNLEGDGRGRHDRMAIVGFNDTAWTELELSHDRARINQALAALPAKNAEGTRLDLALEEGGRAWAASERRANARAALVLLTDGLPNRVPYGPGSTHADCADQECTVLKAATGVKALGLRVFTIGLGHPRDVHRQLLEKAASRPGDYHYAPDVEDLEAIYREVAERVRECP